MKRRTSSARDLEKAKVSNGNPKSLEDVCRFLNDLAELHPRRIEREDKKFFYPSMGYFTQQEQEAMLQEFWDFDRKLIHEKYTKVLDEIERITLG